MNTEQLPIGTKIKFIKDLTSEASGDHPALEYARKDQTGEVVGYNNFEGHMVKADDWDSEFGAALNVDFNQVEQ